MINEHAAAARYVEALELAEIADQRRREAKAELVAWAKQTHESYVQHGDVLLRVSRHKNDAWQVAVVRGNSRGVPEYLRDAERFG